VTRNTTPNPIHAANASRCFHAVRQPPASRIRWRASFPRRLGAWSLLVLLLRLQSPAAVVVQIGHNFTGARFGVEAFGEPSDAAIAVGTSQVVEFVNGRYSVYHKATGGRTATMSDRDFWTSAGVVLSSRVGVSDPRIVFDPDSQRWFAVQVDVDAVSEITNRFLLAVSASGDAAGRWSGFAFPGDPLSDNFADFPTLGLDARGVYVGGDMFDGSGNHAGSILVAIPKSDLLATPPTVAGRTSIGTLDSTTHGSVLQPAITFGPASTSEFVLAVGDLGLDFQPHSTLLSFLVGGADLPGLATISDPTTLAVPPYSVPINPPQPNGFHNLENGDARFSSMVSRVGDILYAVHGTEVGTGTNRRAALQWFTLDATKSAVIQTGTITHPELDLFYPSITANPDGTAVIAYNGCSASSFVSGYAVVGDTVNGVLAFGDPVLLQAGAASYQGVNLSTNSTRWGDYSAVSLDPVDPHRFWTLTGYPSTRTAWSMRLTELITRPLLLSVASVGDSLLLAWPGAATGFTLQSSPSLSPGSAWTPVTPSPILTNDQFAVLLPANDPRAFFRLAKP
jgi:hypothetical protein